MLPSMTRGNTALINRLWIAAVSFLIPCATFAQTTEAPSETTLPQVNVIAPTPLLGSGVDRYKVPAQTQVLTGDDLKLQGPPSALGALETQAEGVHLDNSSGNPYQ